MIRALLGGSFDPFHDGHLAMVDALRGHLADLVVVMPACRSPHKDPPLAPGPDRLRMAELAVAGRVGVVVSDLELARGGVSYTVETLEALAARHPADRLRLAIGADSLAGLARWRRPRRILELAELVVFARGDADLAPPGDLPARILPVRDFAVPVSASAVRRDLARGRQPRGRVPDAVLDYIAERGLYRPGGGAGAGGAPAAGGRKD